MAIEVVTRTKRRRPGIGIVGVCLLVLLVFVIVAVWLGVVHTLLEEAGAVGTTLGNLFGWHFPSSS